MRGWIKTPKHLLRKNCIEYVIKNWKPLRFIEIGAGTGDITTTFLEKGFYGVCYDLGKETRNILRINLSRFGKKVEVIESLETLKHESFDYLFAFEVLEHIKNDYEKLQFWSSFLKKGGKILISVPSHMKKYSAHDESVGHVRRYEKEELYLLLERAGYTHVGIVNYGFPLVNITRNVASFLRAYNRNYKALSLEERSIRSGIERAEILHKLSFLFNEPLLLPFILLQRIFFKEDYGDGYVAYGDKL